MPAMTPADPDLADLDTHGAAVLPTLLSPAECASMVALWDDPARFRKEVVMARHGYGSGTYRYFDYPLPEPVARLRTALVHTTTSVPSGLSAVTEADGVAYAIDSDAFQVEALGVRPEPPFAIVRVDPVLFTADEDREEE